MALGEPPVDAPEPIVMRFRRLHDAGCDAVRVNVFGYPPDLEYFGREVIPLMRTTGLRQA
jgi:dimethylsulfone monooxygenase